MIHSCIFLSIYIFVTNKLPHYSLSSSCNQLFFCFYEKITYLRSTYRAYNTDATTVQHRISNLTALDLCQIYNKDVITHIWVITSLLHPYYIVITSLLHLRCCIGVASYVEESTVLIWNRFIFHFNSTIINDCPGDRQFVQLFHGFVIIKPG